MLCGECLCLSSKGVGAIGAGYPRGNHCTAPHVDVESYSARTILIEEFHDCLVAFRTLCVYLACFVRVNLHILCMDVSFVNPFACKML